MPGLATDNAIPSEIADADARRYRALVADCREVGFADSGHMIPDEEPGKYCQVVNEFLASVDARLALA